MNLAHYFTAFHPEQLAKWQKISHALSEKTTFHAPDQFPDFEQAQLAIIGVPTASKGNEFSTLAPDAIRDQFYRLFPSENFLPLMVDLGNIITKSSLYSSAEALEDVVFFLLKKGITPIILGGGQDLIYPVFKAHARADKRINLLTIHPKIQEDHLTSIFLDKHLHEYSNLSHQQYLTSPAFTQFIQKKNWTTLRLGELHQDLKLAEPLIRNADFISVNINAVRAVEAPGTAEAYPSGLYPEEICKLMHYAGMSEKVQSLGIYEVNPFLDNVSGTTSMLAAQMIWHFMDGFFQRQGDYPAQSIANCTEYCVHFSESFAEDDFSEIVFYKSLKSDRWWIKIPQLEHLPNYEKHYLFPCTYADYQEALKGNMPHQFLRVMQKYKEKIEF